MDLKNVLAMQNGFSTLIIRMDLMFAQPSDHPDWASSLGVLRDALAKWENKNEQDSPFYALAHPEKVPDLVEMADLLIENGEPIEQDVRAHFLKMARSATGKDTQDNHLINQHLHDFAKGKHPCPPPIHSPIAWTE